MKRIAMSMAMDNTCKLTKYLFYMLNLLNLRTYFLNASLSL